MKIWRRQYLPKPLKSDKHKAAKPQKNQKNKQVDEDEYEVLGAQP